mmetsp:Transcript_12685/g.19959  ORF Transcript_12685/g.19959 Transcript_12685/m.19959 type:complete len:82 (-) Transcript_12685:540-785(-)
MTQSGTGRPSPRVRETMRARATEIYTFLRCRRYQATPKKQEPMRAVDVRPSQPEIVSPLSPPTLTVQLEFIILLLALTFCL